MHKIIRNLSIFLMLPLLLGSSCPELIEEDVQNNRNLYEVINATTGEKIEKRPYTEERVMKTHTTTALAVKKALINEGINPSDIRILLYYDGLTIADDLPPRLWHNKPHSDTISSPWLDLTRTDSNSGETKITIRIDATAARLISDLYSEPEAKYKSEGFLSIPSIRQGCYNNIFRKSRIALLKLAGYKVPPLKQNYQEARKESQDSYNCVPEEIKQPFKLALSAKKSTVSGSSNDPLAEGLASHLFLYCQDEAEEYYSQLYSHLSIQGLQFLENKAEPQSKWWNEIRDRVEPIKECQR